MELLRAAAWWALVAQALLLGAQGQIVTTDWYGGPGYNTPYATVTGPFQCGNKAWVSAMAIQDDGEGGIAAISITCSDGTLAGTFNSYTGDFQASASVTFSYPLTEISVGIGFSPENPFPNTPDNPPNMVALNDGSWIGLAKRGGRAPSTDFSAEGYTTLLSGHDMKAGSITGLFGSGDGTPKFTRTSTCPSKGKLVGFRLRVSREGKRLPDGIHGISGLCSAA